MKVPFLNLIIAASLFAPVLPAAAQGLQGGVNLDSTMARLSRPALSGNAMAAPPMAPPAQTFNGFANQGGGGLVGNGQFDNSPGNSLVSGADTNAFEIGAERGSKELTLAWGCLAPAALKRNLRPLAGVGL